MSSRLDVVASSAVAEGRGCGRRGHHQRRHGGEQHVLAAGLGRDAAAPVRLLQERLVAGELQAGEAVGEGGGRLLGRRHGEADGASCGEGGSRQEGRRSGGGRRDRAGGSARRDRGGGDCRTGACRWTFGLRAGGEGHHLWRQRRFGPAEVGLAGQLGRPLTTSLLAPAARAVLLLGDVRDQGATTEALRRLDPGLLAGLGGDAGDQTGLGPAETALGHGGAQARESFQIARELQEVVGSAARHAERLGGVLQEAGLAQLPAEAAALDLGEPEHHAGLGAIARCEGLAEVPIDGRRRQARLETGENEGHDGRPFREDGREVIRIYSETMAGASLFSCIFRYC